jgi:tetratricopeptide (TPR) repeat protein
MRALVLMWSGQHAVAGDVIALATRLNPSSPTWYHWVAGAAMLHQGQLEPALANFQHGISRNPEFMPNHIYAAAVLSELDRDEAAQAELGAARRLAPTLSLAFVETVMPYRRAEDRARIIAALRRIGLA